MLACWADVEGMESDIALYQKWSAEQLVVTASPALGQAPTDDSYASAPSLTAAAAAAATVVAEPGLDASAWAIATTPAAVAAPAVEAPLTASTAAVLETHPALETPPPEQPVGHHAAATHRCSDSSDARWTGAFD